MKRFLIIILLAIGAASCRQGGSQGRHPASATDSTSLAGYWYKRYTGTIAGQQVVVNLYHYGEHDPENGFVAVGGNYYYPNRSEIIDLSQLEHHGNQLALSEYVETGRDRDGSDERACTWRITISGNKATGNWISKDSTRMYKIDLQEDYTGAYPLAVLHGEDSARYVPRKGKPSVMSADDIQLAPGSGMKPADAGFLVHTILHTLGGDTLGVKDMQGMIKAGNREALKGYEHTMRQSDGGDEAAEGFNNWESSSNTTCVYNDRGLLQLAFNYFGYYGGAHGNYGSTYLCIDMQEHQVWRLPDIIAVDTPQLNKLLEAEARRVFKMSPTDTLSNVLLVDTIPPTGNFIVSDRGITFCYNPYEIGAYVDGQIMLFIPFTKLQPLITPAFRKRMGIQG